MIPGLASLIFIPLLALTFAHVLWAFGSAWPAATRQALAQTVVGRGDNPQMPPRLASFGTALFCFVAGLFALSLTGTEPDLTLTVIGGLLAFVFLVRGILGYTPSWRRRHAQEPFAGFDRKVYSPMSLVIGVGFVLLVIWRLA